MKEIWKRWLGKLGVLFACLVMAAWIGPVRVQAATEITMETGQTKKLGAFQGETGVYWKSLNAPVATVTQEGVVKGIKEGQATIVATVNGRTARALITVVNPLSLSSLELSMQAGKTALLKAFHKGNSVNVTWKSLNAGVATVNSASGLVSAKKAGQAAIIATYQNYTARCLVTVAGEEAAPLVLSQTECTVNAGTTKTLTAKYNGAVVKPSWKSLNAGVATINSSTGLVTGIKAGQAAMIATYQGFTARCLVTVTGVPSTSIILSQTALSLTAGNSKALKATVTGGSGTVTWKSLNAPVAGVSQTGVVSAYKPGTATITATLNGVTARCFVTVTGTPVTLSLSDTSATLAIGAKKKLTATVSGGSAQISWKSLNAAVATVDASGQVTARKEGTATIQASAAGQTVKCSIWVIGSYVGAYREILEKDSYTFIYMTETGQGSYEAVTINPQDCYFTVDDLNGDGMEDLVIKCQRPGYYVPTFFLFTFQGTQLTCLGPIPAEKSTGTYIWYSPTYHIIRYRDDTSDKTTYYYDLFENGKLTKRKYVLTETLTETGNVFTKNGQTCTPAEFYSFFNQIESTCKYAVPVENNEWTRNQYLN